MAAIDRLLINTRPAGRNQPIQTACQQQHIATLTLPLLALTPLSLHHTEQQWLDAYITGQYQAVVVVSPTAARLACAYLVRQASLSQAAALPTPMVAVGEATAQILRAHGFLVHTPADSSNAGMLAMAQLTPLAAGDRVLVWRGRGGRRQLVTQLRARAVTVNGVAWYARQLPTAAPAQLAQWAFTHQDRLPRVCAVLISSSQAWMHWQHLLAQVTNAWDVHDFMYLPLGPRLAGILAKKNLHYRQVTDLQPATVLAALHRLI